jgi:error-prone DNA polymerase
MSASMIGMRGIVQKEGEVIHVIIQKIVDYGDMLRRVGDMNFPHRPGPGDGATHGGGPDPRDKSWAPEARNLYWPPFAAGADPEEVVRIKSRNFH